ncbi:oxaloacetate decarboxylase, gamma subunit [Carnobacterium sp. 17-4]|uniref:biotin/lipoyl-containing protein n=1 Tax=Carnobacterium sp. (strain 17-4) TaxID=208596 RepID=UPI0002058922|nr:biotin/lipoyl-containing protein [Carnobacterium sp. 17-4]AEB30041.1 oxaloacetate decarboxylase, gamma subunit [Carnobacterium sp. 17-4]
MKNYEITVNGKLYQVSVKEIDGELNKNKEKEPLKSAKSSVDQMEGVTITAPMPGRILSVKVQENQSVKAGETVCLLEAMKMENEIVAPVDGVVSQIKAQSNQSVEVGEVLILITPN